MILRSYFVKVAQKLIPSLNDNTKNAILRHMFPATIVPPRSREGFIVILADKIESIRVSCPTPYISGANKRRISCHARRKELRPEAYFSVTSLDSSIILIKSSFILSTAWLSYMTQPFSKWW